MQALQSMLAALAKMGHRVQAELLEGVAASWADGDASLRQAGSTLVACIRTSLGNSADLLTSAADQTSGLMLVRSLQHAGLQTCCIHKPAAA